MRDEATTPGGATKVWDLTDASAGRSVRRRGFDPGGPISAVLGAVALGAALLPGLAVGTRWSIVLGAGIVAFVIASSAVRRRQVLLSLVLALAGLLLPLAAGAAAVHVTLSARSAVSTTVVSDVSLLVPDEVLLPTPAFAALTAGQRADAERFATSLVLRLRSLHGSFGPYPDSLGLSSGTIVEGGGALRGTPLGAMPPDTRLEYHVTSSGAAFQIIVVADRDETASVAATNALVVPAGS